MGIMRSTMPSESFVTWQASLAALKQIVATGVFPSSFESLSKAFKGFLSSTHIHPLRRSSLLFQFHIALIKTRV